MVLTFTIIIILALSFSSKFRDSLITNVSDFPKLFDSLVVKYEDSPFKLLLLIALVQVILDFILGFSFAVFEVPESIFYNFLSDIFGAFILLWLYNRVTLILFNHNLIGYINTNLRLFKNIIIIVVSIGVILGLNQITIPIASTFPSFEIFEEIRQELFTRPKNNFETILLIFSISIIPAITEEIMMRGILHNTLRQKYGILITISVLTVLFYFFHLDPQMIPFLIITNVVLCLVFEYTKSLVTTILIHFGINFSSLVLFLYNIKAT